jgi:hypothetical protein
MAAIQLGSSYVQDFNSLNNNALIPVAWINDSTLPGWYASRATGTNNLSALSGLLNTGSLASFGSIGSSERALGSIGSASTGDISWGVRLVNNTNNTITGLNLGYTGEQWRNSGTNAAQTVDFQYQIGATSLTAGTWTDYNALDFTSPTFSSTAAALNGNAAANQTALSSTLNLTLNPNQEVWLRWLDIDHTGNDHGLGIDNFSVSAIQAVSAQAVPEPADLMGTALAVCAVAILKRKLSPTKKIKL